MAIWYLDTSAFLKLLVAEEHSAALRRHVRSLELWSSTLLGVEAHRAAPRLEVLRGGLRMLRENDLRPLLPGVRQPALVVHGERDRLVPAAAGEYLACALGNGTLTAVAGAAHAPFVSNAAGVADTLAEFFA